MQNKKTIKQQINEHTYKTMKNNKNTESMKIQNKNTESPKK